MNNQIFLQGSFKIYRHVEYGSFDKANSFDNPIDCCVLGALVC
jgi:hypothetical protein